MGKLVTIAIASYNNAAYIERCIDSVINQSYQNLEILIIDDGSTDDTLERIGKYKADSRVNILEKENGGLSSSRQMALDCANGDYISFIDADDYLLEGYVELMLSKIEKDGSDVCVCSTRFENETGSILRGETSLFKCDETREPVELNISMIAGKQAVIYEGIIGDSWNKLYRVSSLKKSNVRFCMEKGLNGSDTFFNLRILLHGLRYSMISDICYVHVMYSNSAVHRKHRELIKTYEIITDGLIEESKLLSNGRIDIKSISCLWYTWQSVILTDVFKSVACKENLRPAFKKTYREGAQFAKQRGLLACNPMMAKNIPGFVFMLLYRCFPQLLPLYYNLKGKITR